VAEHDLVIGIAKINVKTKLVKKKEKREKKRSDTTTKIEKIVAAD